ncbi:MAG: hypothetical protein SGPRY_003513 [Prymnesium sp.]
MVEPVEEGRREGAMEAALPAVAHLEVLMVARRVWVEVWMVAWRVEPVEEGRREGAMEAALPAVAHLEALMVARRVWVVVWRLRLVEPVEEGTRVGAMEAERVRALVAVAEEAALCSRRLLVMRVPAAPPNRYQEAELRELANELSALMTYGLVVAWYTFVSERHHSHSKVESLSVCGQLAWQKAFGGCGGGG